MSNYSEQHLRETADVVTRLDPALCEQAVDVLAQVRARGGRLFILGVGGSAANASHAVNDFRKIAGLECYAPTDNVSELTARTNDEGWEGVFAEWLKGSRLNAQDGLLVFSVGGGNLEKNVSPNLVRALQLAKERGSAIVGIVGPRRRLHRAGGRRGHHHRHGQPGEHYPSRRGVPGGGVAPVRFPSQAESGSNQVGKHEVKRAVFLDRDGVLNRPVVRDGLPYPPDTVEEFALYEDVPAGCKRLKKADFLLVVATNQPDVGRGTQSREQVEAIHATLRAGIRSSTGWKFVMIRAAAPGALSGASRARACCSMPPTRWAFPCRRATWSETAGATWIAGTPPAAARCSSTAATGNPCASCRTGRSGPSPRRWR